MVKIRLFRTGTKKRPFYRVVAIDSRNKRQGRTLEILGTYDPRGGGGARLDAAAIDKWVSEGAQLSDTVRSLLKRHREAADGPAAAAAAPAEESAGA